MIHSIFPPNNFYSLINAPNKEDLVKGLRRAKVDPVATKNIIPLKLEGVWRNTYIKGSFQEIHDHSGGGDVSGCVFLEDFDQEAGKFYFYNRHASEIGAKWRYLLMGDKMDEMLSKVIVHDAGDVLLFPSYVLHGVTLHRLRRPRTTISFNMSFV
jgi:hypothetical protein